MERDQLEQALAKVNGADVYKWLLSGPAPGAPYRRVEINRRGTGYQLERHTATQVFHENLERDQVPERLEALLGTEFLQLHAWDGAREYAVRITKKGRVLFRSKAVAQAPRQEEGHNREKQYLLPQGIPVPALVDMGVCTADGRVVKSMYAKYRQINRFLEIVDDEAARLPRDKPLHIVDFGCGKSYLTFILYHYFTEIRGLDVRMTGLDLKADVIAGCNKTAEKYGYAHLRFRVGDIAAYEPEGPVDMVLTLHACDTATDHALYNAIRWQAAMIFSVPCCQHELNGQVESARLSILTRYGIVKERMAALMTDAIRGNLLEANGYRTQLLEFVDFAHTPKNILIRAVRRPGGKPNPAALAEAEALIEEFHLDPALCRLLAGDITEHAYTEIDSKP